MITRKTAYSLEYGYVTFEEDSLGITVSTYDDDYKLIKTAFYDNLDIDIDELENSSIDQLDMDILEKKDYYEVFGNILNNMPETGIADLAIKTQGV